MKVIYVGLDVDDAQYHGSALTKHTGEVTTLVPATLAGLLKQIAMIVVGAGRVKTGKCRPLRPLTSQ